MQVKFGNLTAYDKHPTLTELIHHTNIWPVPSSTPAWTLHMPHSLEIGDPLHFSKLEVCPVRARLDEADHRRAVLDECKNGLGTHTDKIEDVLILGRPQEDSVRCTIS